MPFTPSAEEFAAYTPEMDFPLGWEWFGARHQYLSLEYPGSVHLLIATKVSNHSVRIWTSPDGSDPTVRSRPSIYVTVNVTSFPFMRCCNALICL